MLDLNEAEEQREGTGGPIPPKSIVLVRMTVRQPKAEKTGPHPMVTRSDTGMEYLDCEFEVIAGQFEGRKVWDNLALAGVTDGQNKAADIAKRKLRAMVEAARNINPKDQTPNALAGRRIQDIGELQGMVFGIKVGCEKPKPNDKYVNNNIAYIITPDHEAYAHVMGGGEIVSEDPIPEIPQGAAGAGQSGKPAASWGAGNKSSAPQGQTNGAGKTAPSWAKPNAGSTPPPPAQSPPPGHPAYVG